MKRKQLFTLFFAIALSLTTTINAQEKTETDELSLSKGNIENQFEFVIEKSNNYDKYKVVRKTWLNMLRKNVLDSVAKIESDLSAITKTSETQKAEIDKLNASLAEVNNNLSSVTEEKDSISLFGILLSKAAYKSIMWGVIAFLALILFFFIYKFRNANTVTHSSKKALAELEEEYEEYRRKALEREQKARRELQDEINKQKLTKVK